MAYFDRVGARAYRPTQHVSGGWDPNEQHIAPALGLLAHLVEADRDARRSDGLVIARLSYDILGTVPMDTVETSVAVTRPGRTIELVEATLAHGGREAVRLRAWLMQPGDTADLAGTAYPAIAPPTALPPWDPTTVWPGGFIASAQVRRELLEPGRARYWVRTDVPLVRDEAVSELSRAVGLFDIANGMAVRADPEKVAYPNIDLTAHLFTEPAGEWVGFDTTVTFGPGGRGLTSSVIHDERGPVGTVSQILTIRPK
ncbi:thioesterase family protein [Skermania sp. ID1734]|uniref:thioesterase family protein n=1 Tax=Skermania sp. ID1734 TaxID=2597516 RepID=UPI001180F953|nr:thioesterase family protein [Skermania sp. ID1734]TSD96010.1 thioesterase family protein [Skermania sp. ID1734]